MYLKNELAVQLHRDMRKLQHACMQHCHALFIRGAMPSRKIYPGIQDARDTHTIIQHMWQTQVENSTVSGLIRLVVSLECFIEITPDFLCPFMND